MQLLVLIQQLLNNVIREAGFVSFWTALLSTLAFFLIYISIHGKEKEGTWSVISFQKNKDFQETATRLVLTCQWLDLWHLQGNQGRGVSSCAHCLDEPVVLSERQERMEVCVKWLRLPLVTMDGDICAQPYWSPPG